MLTTQDVDAFIEKLRIFNRSEHTLRAYRADLNDLVEFLAGRDFDEMNVADWLTTRRPTWSANTTNRKLAVTRSYAHYVLNVRRFLDDYTPPKALKGRSHPVEGGMEGVRSMIAAAKTNPRKALVALCGFCGLRVHEAVAISPADIDVENMQVIVRGKGDKMRAVPISVAAWEAMEPAYKAALRSSGATLVLCGERQARDVVTRTARCAGLTHTASHDLRHAFGTAVCEAAGVRTAQELLGHASVETTERYTHVSGKRMRDAVESI